MVPRGLESGVFPGSREPTSVEQLLGRLQAALSAASRGEAGLTSLHRSLRDGSSALTASRHAHQALTDELRALSRGLSEVLSDRAALERYAVRLTEERDAALQAAEEVRLEAKRDRDFLIREQDRFLRLALEEHEAELVRARGAAEEKVSTHPVAAAEASAVPEVSAPASSESEPILAVDERPTVPPPPMLRARRVALSRPSPMPEQASGERTLGDEGAEATETQRSPSDVPSATETQRSPSDVPSAIETQRSPSDVPSAIETQRSPSDAPVAVERELGEDQRQTYPPGPAVLDLEALAAEVDGNSERPPPIPRAAALEAASLNLRPAPLPSQLQDTLVSRVGDGAKGNDQD